MPGEDFAQQMEGHVCPAHFDSLHLGLTRSWTLLTLCPLPPTSSAVIRVFAPVSLTTPKARAAVSASTDSSIPDELAFSTTCRKP